MKLVNVLITEGRKEDLEKKYSKSLGQNGFDYVFNDPFMKKTNYKYGDFLLKNLSYPTKSEIDDAISLLKKFDKFSRNLEKKDINQYEDLSDLSIELSDYKSKNQSKKIDETDTEKIYEDPNVLIVRPLTHKSSCKYGAGTRWCTTDYDATHYGRYTSGTQGLYYIILKKFNQSNKFYKIAVHKTTSGDDEWYDALDKPFSEREKEVFNLGAPKIIQTINNHYDNLRRKKGSELLYGIFDNHDITSTFDITKEIGSEVPVSIVFRWPEKFEDNHYNVIMDLMVNGELLDRYLTYILVTIDGEMISMNIELEGDDKITPKIDTDMSNESMFIRFGNDYFKNAGTEEGFTEVTRPIAERFIRLLKTDNKFRSIIIKNPKKQWRPNRHYGYTFKENKGLIGQMVNNLNSGKKMTKLDFLVNTGRLDKKEENGKTLYSIHGNNEYRPSSDFRGQHSAFFNSAVLAGIIVLIKKAKNTI